MSEGEDVSDDEIQGPPAALLEQEEFDTITSIATSCPVCFDDVTTGPIKVCSPCGTVLTVSFRSYFRIC